MSLDQYPVQKFHKVPCLNKGREFYHQAKNYAALSLFFHKNKALMPANLSRFVYPSPKICVLKSKESFSHDK